MVAIIALLISLLLPALQYGKTAARIVRAHAELRGIEVALRLYMDDWRDQLPPTRFSCSMRTAYELPVELGEDRYLPYDQKFVQTPWGDGFVGAVQMQDVFAPEETYKYRAVGAAIMNEFTLLEPPNGASLWVPTTFPDCEGEAVREYKDPQKSPVRFAIWSIGPDRDSPRFAHIPGQMPIPSRFWCRGASDSGVITHFQGRDGKRYMSP